MRKIIKRTGLLIAAPFLIVVLYLFSALIGGLIPSGKSTQTLDAPLLKQFVYLTTNALHADIAIPVNSLSLEKFAFLRQADFPLDNSDLEYLIIGWGSREFYTSTANYSDMKLGTIWRAATGDDSVMHVAPGGDLAQSENMVKVPMTEQGFAKMLDFILGTFDRKDGQPKILSNTTFGYGDVFYKAKGWFNIFNPCNVWVSEALSKAGVSIGLWTPTTYSLILHHKLYN